jgi:CRISPR/Cas system-associated protein endoribonuclease Cas2
MQIYFITFGSTHNYSESLNRIRQEAENLGVFDKIIIYTEKDFDKDYLEKHGDFIKNNKTGYGYWIWKSYFTKKTFEIMDLNDILIYADCGCHLVNNDIAKNRLQTYITLCNRMNSGNIAFQMCFPEKQYTKMDVFVKLNEVNDKMMESGQLVGGIFVMRKCINTINLINKYYELCEEYKLIDNTESNIQNDTSFIAHRNDQSVFSILRKQMGCILIPDETWYNNFMSPEAQSKPILATRIRR